MVEKNDFGSVADLYDLYVPATFDLDFFLEEALRSGGEVLELMAGTGRVSLPLIRAGVRLTCVDLSAEMLDVLRVKLDRAGLRADLYAMDACQLELGKTFDQIIIPFNSFSHLTHPDQQRQAMARFHRHLRPGGELIVTLANPNLRRKSVDGSLRFFRKYPLGGQKNLLLWIMEDFRAEDENIVDTLQFFEEYDREGRLFAKRMLELQFRLTAREDFETLARSTGFEITAFYGDYSRAEFREDISPVMIWVLRAN